MVSSSNDPRPHFSPNSQPPERQFNLNRTAPFVTPGIFPTWLQSLRADAHEQLRAGTRGQGEAAVFPGRVYALPLVDPDRHIIEDDVRSRALISLRPGMS
jgi:hypothetical protein